MVKVKDIAEIINNFAPQELAYPWDNPGLIIGDRQRQVKKVYVTLDVFKFNVDEAISVGADMIVSHHPILFKGIKKIDTATQEGYVVRKLIENDIALYAAHTNLDCTVGGINDVLADKLGITECEIIEKNAQFDGCGLGRIGNLRESVSLGEFAKSVKNVLGTPFVRVCGDLNKKIARVAVGGGACDDLIPTAAMMGADVMVTADMKYHIASESMDSGIAVIDAGHFPTEAFATEIFARLLADVDVEIYTSTEADVFAYV